jgi:glycine cleavage system H protein
VIQRVCGGVAAGLSRLGVAARFRAPNDIAIGGRKVSGSSGYTAGRAAVLQGTVLVTDEVAVMAHALRLAEPLPDGTVRAGFTPVSIALAGDVLVFTPKRIGRDFEAQRSFATIECGKWVGSARAAFDGVVVASNAELERKPKLLNDDAVGAGWILIVRPADAAWHARLVTGPVTGPVIGPAFEAWLASEAYKDRTG